METRSTSGSRGPIGGGVLSCESGIGGLLLELAEHAVAERRAGPLEPFLDEFERSAELLGDGAAAAVVAIGKLDDFAVFVRQRPQALAEGVEAAAEHFAARRADRSVGGAVDLR